MLQNAVAVYKKDVRHTLKPPIELLSGVMKHLVMKGQTFKLFDIHDDSEIEAFVETLEQVDSTLTRDDTT